MNIDHKLSHSFFEKASQTWIGRHVAVLGATHLIWLMIGVLVGVSSWSSFWSRFVLDFSLLYLFVLLLPAWGITMVISLVGKRIRPYVELKREALISPFVHTASFPSGHATIAFSLVALSVNYPGLWPYMLVAAVIVAISRVAVGVHYASDVIVGSLIGFFVTRAFEIIFIIVLLFFK